MTTATPTGEQLWTVPDVARRLKFSRTRIYEFINSGRLKSKKIGGARRITETSLLEFIASFDGAGEVSE